MTGGRVTDARGHAAVASLVTAGVVLLAAGCASATPRGSAAATAATVRVIRGQLGLSPPDTS